MKKRFKTYLQTWATRRSVRVHWHVRPRGAFSHSNSSWWLIQSRRVAKTDVQTDPYQQILLQRDQHYQWASFFSKNTEFSNIFFLYKTCEDCINKIEVITAFKDLFTRTIWQCDFATRFFLIKLLKTCQTDAFKTTRETTARGKMFCAIALQNRARKWSLRSEKIENWRQILKFVGHGEISSSVTGLNVFIVPWTNC